MSRRLKEEKNHVQTKWPFGLAKSERELFLRIAELEHKVVRLGGDPNQLELDI
jgi:hypothetical protein|tara:strand:- start:803 stop:961 length:159 start_codon:yes stop_codon:yes gene_type:complete